AVILLVCVQFSPASDNPALPADSLVQVLVQKGVLTAEEGKAISQLAPDQQSGRLLTLLRDKGVISAEEFASLAPASTQVAPNLVASTTAMAPAVEPEKIATTPAKPEAPTFIPAVAPIRVLQLEPSKPNGLIPDIKLGSGAKLKLYGMFKAS